MNKQRYEAVRRVNFVGAFVNLIQAILKVVVGIVGASPALFADGIHSFSDLLANILVWIASKAGHAGPDQNHPYGHGRFETFGSFALGIFLIFVGFGLIGDAVLRIIHHDFITPHIITLVVAIISVALNESVFRYSLNIATRINSTLLRASAYHNRADSLSSFIVIISILGGLAGLHYADGIATVFIAGFIIKIALELVWNAVYELSDAGIPDEQVKAFEELIMSLSGVKHMHRLRTRKMGDRIFLDVHILIACYASASEGHYIAETAHYYMKQKFPTIEDMTIHIDTEDHPETVPERLLPNRRDIEAVLFPVLKKDLPHYAGVMDLFYFRERLEVQVILPLYAIEIKSAAEWKKSLSETLKSIPDVAAVTIRFEAIEA